MPGGLFDLILHPDAFFARVSQEKVNLVPPVLIVGAGALLFIVVNLVYWAFPTRQGYSISFLTSTGIFRNLMLAQIITSVIIPVCVWVFISIILYILARIAGSTGSFPATFRDVGYGMLPWILSVILPFIVILHRFLTYTGGPVSGGNCGIWFMPPMYCTVPLLGILVWSGYLWMLSLRHTHGITPAESAIITGIPVVICLISAILCRGIF
jgi:hypothetical protein